MSKLDRTLSIFLAAAIVVTLGCICYFVAVPKKGERFTEFYILGKEGKAENYPKQVISGEPVYILVGVVNHEHRPASYQVKVTINGMEDSETNTGTLAHGKKWEEKICFAPKSIGERQKVEFYLYKNGEGEPYLKEPLRLYLDVTPP